MSMNHSFLAFAMASNRCNILPHFTDFRCGCVIPLEWGQTQPMAHPGRSFIIIIIFLAEALNSLNSLPSSSLLSPQLLLSTLRVPSPRKPPLLPCPESQNERYMELNVGLVRPTEPRQVQPTNSPHANE